MVDESAHAGNHAARDEAHRLGLAGVLKASWQEKNEAGDEFRMLRGEQERDLGSETAGDQDGRAVRADGAEKLREGLDMFLGIQRGGWTLGFSVTDQIRRDDFAVHREAGVNLRPFVGGSPEKHPMKKNQRHAGTANMVNKIPEGGIRYACGENGGGNLIGDPAAVCMTAAMAQCQSESPENTDTDSHADDRLSFPDRRHGRWRGRASPVERNGKPARELPAGFGHAGNVALEG